MTRATGRDGWTWLLLLLGLGYLATGTWMFVDPLHWYHELPAGVPDFGDFNPHFVRDIACAFVTVGVALVWAGFAPRYRVPLVSLAAIFTAAHALLHVYDTLRGAVDAHHWWLDLPGVYVPALLLAGLAVGFGKREGGFHAT